MKVAITGKPGIGKTTACIKIYEALKDKIAIAGFITKEIRVGRERVGFEIIELNSDFNVKLAEKKDGYPKVGKYRVYVENIDMISKRIEDYMKAELIIIDEVGPMELKSREFVRSVEKLVNSDKDVILTIHYKLNHPLLNDIRSKFDVVTLDYRNRDKIVREVIEGIDSRRKS